MNGQKVWTSLAHLARYGMLLARTDPDLPKHKGLTYFVVDMHQPGVEVRPAAPDHRRRRVQRGVLRRTRAIPDAWRLGPVGDGWRVAITTLMNERVSLSGPGSVERRHHRRQPGAAAHRPQCAGARSEPAAAPRRARGSTTASSRSTTSAPATAVGAAPRPGPRARSRSCRGGVQPAAAATGRRPRGRERCRVGGRGPRRGGARSSFVGGDERRSAHRRARVPALAGQHHRGRDLGDHAQHPRRARARAPKEPDQSRDAAVEGRAPLG